MNEPRKPIFGFLWPGPDPDAPVDAAFRQVRKVRVAPRGPVRLAALVLGSLLVTTATATVLMVALSTRLSPVTFAVGALCATGLALVLRGWVVGTYVTDAAITVETTWRQVSVPWGAVAAVATDEQRVPWLGLPLPARAERCVLHLRDGSSVRTHVYGTSPDLWLRADAFDIARLRLEHWAERA